MMKRRFCNLTTRFVDALSLKRSSWVKARSAVQWRISIFILVPELRVRVLITIIFVPKERADFLITKRASIESVALIFKTGIANGVKGANTSIPVLSATSSTCEFLCRQKQQHRGMQQQYLSNADPRQQPGSQRNQ